MTVVGFVGDSPCAGLAQQGSGLAVQANLAQPS